jgi:hypothetical protein
MIQAPRFDASGRRIGTLLANGTSTLMLNDARNPQATFSQQNR